MTRPRRSVSTQLDRSRRDTLHMAVSFDTRELSQRLAGSSIDRDALAAQPALTGLDVGRARSRSDAAIDTAAERERMLDALDALDGRRDHRITVVNRHGTITAAADPLRAVADLVGDDRLRDQILDGLRSARLDPRIVHVGMQNNSAAREVEALRQRAPVVSITDVPGQNGVVTRSGSFTLTDPSDIARFAQSLGLPPDATAAVRDILLQADAPGRRELAELASVLAAGERGERIPPRLILSGHGNGETTFGQHDDRLDDEHVIALARALPRGAAQIRHLHLAACQHGWEGRMEAIRRGFPNLESMWGYTGFSPTGAPARHHQRVWERATRDGDVSDLRRESVRDTHRGGEVSTWTRVRGFEGIRGRELDAVRGELMALVPYIDGVRLGRIAARSNDPTLRRAYELTQEFVNNPDFDEQSADLRSEVRSLRDQLLRLRFYDHVAPRFFERYRAEIERGYQALGRPTPDFGRLPRAELVRELGRLQETGLGDRHVRRTYELLARGLGRLEPSLIPVQWV